MNIESKIEAIYKAHKESGLYNDSFENVIYKLTNSFDYFYFELLKKSIESARNGTFDKLIEDDDEFDKYRHAFRACIKFAYEDCVHGSFDRHIEYRDIVSYQKEIKETVQFNHIRNMIDRYRLGMCGAEVKDDVLCLNHVKGERPLVYDAYSRVYADKIPGGKNYVDTFNVASINMMIVERLIRPQSFKSKKLFKPSNDELTPLISKLMTYYLKDLDWDINFLVGNDYYLGYYLLAYCYIAAIGICKTAFLLSLKSKNSMSCEPSIMYPKQRLIDDIAETTGMKREIAEKAIRDMTYDYEFHKDRVTIYQPLFEIGDYIICSSNLVFYSYVIDKITKYFDIKGTNKRDLTIYHKYMSDKMNNRMADNLPTLYKNLVTFKNCILSNDGERQAEVDLLVFDKQTKRAGLVELKNYTPVDNELDSIKKEEHINKAIKERLIKDKRVMDNLSEFFKQNNIPTEFMEYKFSSLLVTNSYSGGVNVKEDIKVVDEALFYYLLDISNGDFEKALDKIENKEFFKTMEEILQIENYKNRFSYKGILVDVMNKVS